jgi:DtxR family Mn-dependent transcriptional regulator
MKAGLLNNLKPSRDNKPTPTIEDYLAVIYIQERDGEEIIPAHLAKSLEVAPPTVTVTLRRMERDGWIRNDHKSGIALTSTGKDAASSVIRRHMLTEWMLTRMLNVPWSETHAEADHIEHTISNEIEEKMRANLDDPRQCPHGNPLPGYEHITATWLPLTSIRAGEKVTIRRIHETAEDNLDLLRYLESNHIIPGRVVEVHEVLEFNQTISLRTDDKEISLGFPAAQFLFVEKVPA